MMWASKKRKKVRKGDSTSNAPSRYFGGGGSKGGGDIMIGLKMKKGESDRPGEVGRVNRDSLRDKHVCRKEGVLEKEKRN